MTKGLICFVESACLGTKCDEIVAKRVGLEQRCIRTGATLSMKDHGGPCL